MNIFDAQKKLEAAGQAHVLRFYEKLHDNGKAELVSQIEHLDMSFSDCFSEHSNADEKITGIPVLTISQIPEKYSEYEAKGMEAIRAGKVAAVMLAGGQGSRLGTDIPKGAVDIGITRSLYIFECLINNLLEVTKKAGAFVPLCIMTSAGNDAYTREFFAEHDYFGYDPAFIKFFIQESYPATDFDGKYLLSEKSSLALSPNGNGGWYGSMKHCGLADELIKAGVAYINCFAVDNVLQRIADPVFIGAVIENGSDAGAKVVKKAYPDEKIGLICNRNGHPSVIEYYELDKERAEATDGNGELLYNYGVILNYLFSVKLLEKSEEKDSAGRSKHPLHRVRKKVKYIDETGKLITPETENAYKFETLALDLIALSEHCLPFEVLREKEFAPIKNKTGADSVDTARELLIQNGITV
jgi:UDP-N-acetylglucosamine/UDP-N-acetylgalactosamine diphosphorylase